MRELEIKAEAVIMVVQVVQRIQDEVDILDNSLYNSWNSSLDNSWNSSLDNSLNNSLDNSWNSSLDNSLHRLVTTLGKLRRPGAQEETACVFVCETRG